MKLNGRELKRGCIVIARDIDRPEGRLTAIVISDYSPPEGWRVRYICKEEGISNKKFWCQRPTPIEEFGVHAHLYEDDFIVRIYSEKRSKAICEDGRPRYWEGAAWFSYLLIDTIFENFVYFRADIFHDCRVIRYSNAFSTSYSTPKLHFKLNLDLLTLSKVFAPKL